MKPFFLGRRVDSDEQRREHERGGRKQLNGHVERRSSGILRGSPTVSPVTLALCASDPFPPKLPISMYFFALSHAPPTLSRNSAMRMPVTVANIINPPRHAAPRSGRPVISPMKRNMTPTNVGTATARMPGNRISRSAARVTSSTHARLSGFAFHSMISGCSLNCLRTSLTTSPAVLPTAAMARPTIKNIIMTPRRPATSTSGVEISTESNFWFAYSLMSSMNAPKRTKQASEALPML